MPIVLIFYHHNLTCKIKSLIAQPLDTCGSSNLLSDVYNSLSDVFTNLTLSLNEADSHSS